MHFIEFGIAFCGLLWSVLIIVCGLLSLLSHIYYKVNLFVCFLGVTTLCGGIFHSPLAGFSLLILEVS
jgi:hypothetical protein